MCTADFRVGATAVAFQERENSCQPARGGLHGRIVRVQDHGFPQNEISHHQDIHSRAQETIDRFFRAADDRLVVVERGVHNDGHAGEVAKRADQFPVERVCSAADRLEPRRPVDVSGRWDSGAVSLGARDTQTS